MYYEYQFSDTREKAIEQRRRAAQSLADASRKLSSGYRINSAGDDPAGLAVSEKIRSLDRGLRQGIRNISDGLNFIDTVDGASEEIHSMLDRLKEIAVEAANGTYSDMDRSALDLEYQQILGEIDQIADSAEFNGMNLFEPHKPVYSSFVGNVAHNKPIVIDETNSEITVNYTMDGEPEQLTVYLKHGTYSAEECADMMDDIFYNFDMGLIIGLDDDKHFTMQLEGGHVDSISGAGASLFYNTTIGSATGFLVGVTNFGDTGMLNVVNGVNNVLNFRIGNADDTVYHIEITPNTYTRSALIDEINAEFAAAGISDQISAVPYKNEKGDQVIAPASVQVVTGLEGNFIMIDETSSPIYDICKHSTLKNTRLRSTVRSM